MIHSLAFLLLACAAADPVETSAEPTTHLYVRTTPAGAQILLDGKELGTSPGVFPVQPGERRRLVIELDGRIAKEQRITIRDGRITRIELVLTPPKPAAASKSPTNPNVESRSVRKKISEFPEPVDLSTPESACAAHHRASATMDGAAILDLSWVDVGPEERKRFASLGVPRDLTDEQKAQLEAAEILEVLAYGEELAAVVSRLDFPDGEAGNIFSLKTFGRIDGTWKLVSQERCASLETAVSTFHEKKDRLWQRFQETRKALAAAPTGGTGPAKKPRPALDKFGEAGGDDGAVREVVSKFVEAALQDDPRSAATFLTHKMYSDPDEQVGEVREAVAAGLKMSAIEKVHVAQNRALVATQFARIRDRKTKEPVCTVYSLSKRGTGWAIDDIDMEDEQGLADEIRRFRETTQQGVVGKPPRPSKDPVSLNADAAPELPPEAEVETRSVGKKVSDFPEAVDLSTPESALAALYRAGTNKDIDAAADLSWTTIDMTGVEEFWTTSDPETLTAYREALLNAEILKVLNFKEDLAAVIYRWESPLVGNQRRFSLRTFGQIDGKWKNLDEEEGFHPSLEAAASTFQEEKGRRWQRFQETRKALAAGKPLSFSPVIERVVNDDDPQLGNFLIDFDTGEVLSPPVEEMKRARQSLEEWIVRRGVDAIVETKTSVRGLMGVDMIVVPIDSKRWNRISPNDVAEAVALGRPGRPIAISAKGDLPATFIFQTRENAKGVLQILEFTQEPRGVKIRYKVVEPREFPKELVSLTFEVDEESAPDAEAVDVDKLLGMIRRRLDRGWVGRVEVRRVGRQQIEVIAFTTDPEHVRRIERLVENPGTIELRVLANERDHKELIERAQKEKDRRVLNPDGSLAAWWVPLATEQSPNRQTYQGAAVRTVEGYDGDVSEVLVVADPFDVTDDYLVEATAGEDSSGRPNVQFAFNSRGGQLLGGLTGANLPDRADGFSRRLGIILNGKLHSAPAIRSVIHDRGEITGDFTREEAEDLASVLNSGALPLPLEKVSELRTSR